MATVFILCFCMSLCGYAPAYHAVARRHPNKDELSIKYAVDDYVWSDAAPRSLRRKYALSSMSCAIGCLALAQYARLYETNSDRRFAGIAIGSVFAIMIAVSTMRKIYKHGL